MKLMRKQMEKIYIAHLVQFLKHKMELRYMNYLLMMIKKTLLTFKMR